MLADEESSLLAKKFLTRRTCCEIVESRLGDPISWLVGQMPVETKVSILSPGTAEVLFGELGDSRVFGESRKRLVMVGGKT